MYFFYRDYRDGCENEWYNFFEAVWWSSLVRLEIKWSEPPISESRPWNRWVLWPRVTLFATYLYLPLSALRYTDTSSLVKILRPEKHWYCFSSASTIFPIILRTNSWNVAPAKSAGSIVSAPLLWSQPVTLASVGQSGLYLWKNRHVKRNAHLNKLITYPKAASGLTTWHEATCKSAAGEATSLGVV